MGVSPEDARGMIRFSLAHDTTSDEIDYTLEHVPAIVERMRRSAAKS
jgi:cysteine desulfurase